MNKEPAKREITAVTMICEKTDLSDTGSLGASNMGINKTLMYCLDLGAIMPLLGLTRYALGAVVLILKATWLVVGFSSSKIADV